MKKLLLILVFSVSCQDTKVGNEQLNQNIEENQEKLAFMSFFPGMSHEMEEALIQKEIKNGNLKKVNEGDRERIIYTLHFDNSAKEFNLWVQEYCVTLFKTSEENKERWVYENELDEIVKLYQKKYKIISENEYPLPKYKDHYIVMENGEKVIVIEGMIESKDNIGFENDKGQFIDSWYSISINHYSKQSYEEFQIKKEAERQAAEKQKEKYFQEQKKLKSAKNKKTLNDI